MLDLSKNAKSNRLYIIPKKKCGPSYLKKGYKPTSNLVFAGILYVFFPFRLTFTLFGFHYSCHIEIEVAQEISFQLIFQISFWPSRDGTWGRSAWQKVWSHIQLSLSPFQSNFSPNRNGDQNWRLSPFIWRESTNPSSPGEKKNPMVCHNKTH